MIIGLGTDLCDIERVEKTLQRFPRRFENRLFTKQEQERAERRPQERRSFLARARPTD